MTQDATKVYVIVGHPISQVKSPEVFNRWFQDQRANAVMIPLDISQGGLSDFVEMFRKAENIHGAIVTIPYKTVVTGYIDRPSMQVSALGAANVIRRANDKEIEGDMVDGMGFIYALSKNNISLKGKHILIIGCGGAGSAVAWDALNSGVSRLSLLDIDHEKGNDLLHRLVTHYPKQEIKFVTRAPKEFDIVLNATPLGMQEADPLPMQIKDIPEGAVVADAVTSPSLTSFLKGAKMKGHTIQTGPEMVLGQSPLIAEYFGIKDFQV
jgi:shikimate dehydrogenase